jgi:hypothetical protein
MNKRVTTVIKKREVKYRKRLEDDFFNSEKIIYFD